MGSNVTVFSYGSSKSGKTYQIFGTDTQPGLLPQCAEMIFASVSLNQDPDVDIAIHVSMVELSSGHIVDMLDTSGAPLELICDPLNGTYVDGLKMLPVTTWDDMLKIIDLQRDENRSCVDPTKRHTIFQVSILQTLFETNSDEIRLERTSTLSFVDLGASGNEDEGQTFGVGHALTNLHEVVNKIRQKQSQRRARKEFRKKDKKGKKAATLPPYLLQNAIKVPFRMNNLTCLLEEGLDKSSRALFIGCLAPNEYAESIRTLEYISTLKKDKSFAIVGGKGTSLLSRSPPRSQTASEIDHGRMDHYGARTFGGTSTDIRKKPPIVGSYSAVSLENRNRGAKTALGTLHQEDRRRKMEKNTKLAPLKRASDPYGFLPKIDRNQLLTR